MDPNGNSKDPFGGGRQGEPRRSNPRPGGVPDELFDVVLDGSDDATAASADEDRAPPRAAPSDADLIDAIVDDDLTRSIEAGAEGPWSESGTFVDPKLKQIEEQLKAPPIRPRSYKKRRLDEVLGSSEAVGKQARPQRKVRTAATPSAETAPAAGADSGNALGAASQTSPAAGPPARQGRTRTTAEPAGWTEVAPPPPPPDRLTGRDDARPPTPAREVRDAEDAIAAVQANLVLAYLPSLFAAALVFAATTMVHGLVLGWDLDLVSRGAIATAATGVLWKRFQGGRVRAIAIGAAAYVVAFLPWTQPLGQETAVGMLFGLLTVATGSGLIGVQQDEFAGGA